MISKKTKEFIEKNSFCPEYIFKDWSSFLDLVYSEGARVSSILWWDRCNISQQRHSVGSGGYRDPSDPNYIYLETQLFEEGLESKTLEEIKDRIRRVEKDGLRYSDKFKSHFLVPSFYLDE